MTRLEDLTLKSADDRLGPSEMRELHSLLEADSEAAREHLALLSFEAALRASRKDFDLSDSILRRLERERAESIEAKVISQIQFEAPPKWHPRAARRPSLFTAPPSTARVLALAAGIVLLISLGVWFFGPRMGEPILANVNGTETSIERGTEFIPVTTGSRLQRADVLRTGNSGKITIAFEREKTTIEVLAGSELKMASFATGKRFELRIGKIEATVARQRPFAPLVIATPQAEARVLGTHFTLTIDADVSRLDVMEGKVGLLSVHDGKKCKVGAGQYARAGRNIDLRGALPGTGKILYEYWTNFPDINNFWWESISEDPGVVEYPARFEAPSHAGSNFLARIRGYVHPPKTGDYTFWTAGDSGCQFLLSPDDQPENKVTIATANNTKPREWTGEINLQQSSSITLIAGRKYYIEAVQKYSIEAAQNPTDDDHHLAVAWQGPDRQRQVIPGEFLSPFEAKRKEKKR